MSVDNQFKVLLLEGIHSIAKERLEKFGIQVTLESRAFSEDELIKAIPKYDVVGLRSKTQITEKVLDHSSNLLAFGAFCIGTNQIAIDRAHTKGLPVFNAPYSNTRSVAELVICEMVALARKLGQRSAAAHQGVWMKSATNSHEVRGKTLGIIGYGHIGSQVSILAEAMGLEVVFYDIIKKLPLGNARAMDSFNELLNISDFVTLHVPETPQTKMMMSTEQLSEMKKHSYLINASRGTVVNIPMLAQFLKKGYLAGAAVDVFPVEPGHNEEPFSSELQGLDNVILTPHIGGSTEEAQKAIGAEVAESIIRFLTGGSTTGAVNFPNVELPVAKNAKRMMNVHKNVPGVLGAINSVVSDLGVNISAQYLATEREIGVLVMDVDAGDVDKLSEKIGGLETSIKTRVL